MVSALAVFRLSVLFLVSVAGRKLSKGPAQPDWQCIWPRMPLGHANLQVVLLLLLALPLEEVQWISSSQSY